jgi:hypothetical protein
MTDRITKPITNMKEYGRKPYLEKDYQNMMEATWHKAQDNSQIVVQSVKKKPYDPFTYQEMEQKGDLPIFTYPRDNFYKWDFPFNKSDATVPTSRYKPINPRINPTGLKYVSPNDSMSKDYRANLRWILCPDEIEAGNWYTIRVANSVKSTYKTEGGRTSLQRYIYYPSFFSFRNLTKETTGFELKVFLPSAVYDNYGSIMGLWHDSYQWYDTKKQAGQIRELINYLWQRGYAGANMEARLIANTGAEGEIELQATDGRNVIKKKVSMGAGIVVVGNGGYYKVSDLANGITLKYNNFTATKTTVAGIKNTVTESEVSDNGRPTETITLTYSFKWGGIEYFTTTGYSYNYYELVDEEWVFLGSENEGYFGSHVGGSGKTGANIKRFIKDRAYTGGDNYFQYITSYIWHSFNETYTEYSNTFIIDFNTGLANGNWWIRSYDYDSNNYCVVGTKFVNSPSFPIGDYYLAKGKNNGIDFSLELEFGDSIVYGTVS